MFIITAILVLCSLAERIRCGSLLEVTQVNVSESCSPFETECAFGCCPFAQATCCADGFECCEHGKTCIPFIGICVGAENNNGEIALKSEKSTRIRSSVFRCPPRTTECAPDRCCKFEQAVCCPDGLHCCPKGYRCDSAHQQCVRDWSNGIGRYLYNAIASEKPLRKMFRKSPYKACPGVNQMCPTYMSCCIHDNGEWSCCPNTALPEITYGSGQCCDTIFGHMCCPDDFPTCTIFGCTK